MSFQSSWSQPEWGGLWETCLCITCCLLMIYLHVCLVPTSVGSTPPEQLLWLCNNWKRNYFDLQQDSQCSFPSCINSLQRHQGCQVLMSKKGGSTLNKNEIKDKYKTTPLKQPNALLKGNRYIYFIHEKNKAHSINELLETFGLCWRVTWNCKPVSMKQEIINSHAEFPRHLWSALSCSRIRAGFNRFDRFLLIGPRAKGGPALRQLTTANLHFQSKLLVNSAVSYLASHVSSFCKIRFDSCSCFNSCYYVSDIFLR